jgi:outer membrane protein TolC
MILLYQIIEGDYFMIRFLFFILLIFNISEATTINELIDAGLANSSIIKRDRLQTELIEAKREESRAKKFGEINMVGSYTHYNLPRTLAPIVPSSLSPNSSIETTKDLFSTGVRYSVPLFTGGLLKEQIAIDALSKTISQKRAKLNREELIYNIRSLYLSGLSFQELIESQKGYIETLERLKDTIKISVELGKKAKIDLIKSQNSIEEANGKLARLESSLKMIKSTLITTTHIDTIGYFEPIVVDMSIDIESDRDEDYGSLERFRLQDLEIEKRNRAISKIEATNRPQVGANSYIGYNYDIDNSLNSELLWQIGLSLKWNIFDFDKSSAEIEQAKIAKLQATVQKEATTEGFKKLLAKAINRIDIALADHKTDISTLNLLQESQKIEEARYSAGVATINDLLLAKAKTELTKSKLIESEYNYQNGVYYLEYLLERGENR